MGEALALVRAAAENHIDTIVASPHMLDGVYNVLRDDVFARAAELNDALREHGIHVTVLVGADVHAEAEVPELLGQGKLITVADRGKHLMLELPPDVVPREMDQLLFAIQLHGVRPIISHPERNRVIQEDPGELLSLVEAGSLTQVTAASLVGDFGSQVQDCARALLDRRLVHFVATDMHGVWRRRPRLSEAAALMVSMMGREDAAEILERNPQAVIHGKHIDVPEPVMPKPRKRWFFW
jgi:protein-tyrosine phosphatase